MSWRIIGFISSICLATILITSAVFAEDTPKVLTQTSGTTATRGMIVSELFGSENTNMSENPAVFKDVAEGTDYYVLVNWATQKGIISGFGDGTFRPDDNITKEQFAVILYKYAVYKNYDTTQGGMAVRELKDYEKISPWALRPVAWSLYSGLMTGNEEQGYEPQSYITKEYANTVIDKFNKTIAVTN